MDSFLQSMEGMISSTLDEAGNSASRQLLLKNKAVLSGVFDELFGKIWSSPSYSLKSKVPEYDVRAEFHLYVGTFGWKWN